MVSTGFPSLAYSGVVTEWRGADMMAGLTKILRKGRHDERRLKRSATECQGKRVIKEWR